MATAEDYAKWIIDNQDKQGTPDFDAVAEAYRAARDKQTKPVDPGMRGSKADAFLTGMRDPIDAGAQMLPRVLAGVSSGFGLMPNRVSQFFDDEASRVDQMVKSNEAKYQDARGVQGRNGIDAMRIAGNVASPANIVVGSRVAALAPASRVVQAAAAGGAMGALNPVTEGNFATEKAKQVAGGTAAGIAMAPISAALSRIIKPNTQPQAQTLLDSGVTPTPGQILGGAAQRAEDGMTSLPILGDAIKSAQRRAVTEFNAAAWNRVLAPIGEKLPKDMKAGNEVAEYVGQKVSDAYSALLPKLGGELDKPFLAELSTLRGMGMSMPKQTRDQFYRILKNEVSDRFTQSGKASGETIKNIESKLGEMARGYSRSSDYDQRTLGGAIQETQAALRRMLERNNPKYQGDLKAINEAYANLVRVENAAGRIGAKEGVFSAAQLRGAVRQADPSKGKRQFAKGNALMQDLADAGEATLGAKVPDSGTPFRMMNAAALGGGYWLHPWIPAAELAATLPYSSIGGKATAALLAKRPAFADPVSKFVRDNGYLLSPALQPVAGLLE